MLTTVGKTNLIHDFALFCPELPGLMSSRTPLLISVPLSQLRSQSDTVSDSALPRSVSAFLDDLDNESDSGFDDGRSHDQPEDDRAPGDAAEKSRERHQPSLADNGPVWTRWASEKVTCIASAYATTEDRQDCIYLVAGCENGSLKLYCSLVIQSTTTASGEASTTTAAARSVQMLRKPSSHDKASRASPPASHARPHIGRSSSDNPATPRASIHIHDRDGLTGLSAPTRIPSSVYGGSSASSAMRTRSRHSVSLSLSKGSSPLKSLATVSISTSEGFSEEQILSPTTSKLPVSPTAPHFAPEIDPRPSISVDRPPAIADFDYSAVHFQHVATVYLNWERSSIHYSAIVVNDEGAPIAAVITRSGAAFKIDCRDGTILNRTQFTSGADKVHDVVHNVQQVVYRDKPFLLITMTKSTLTYMLGVHSLEVNTQ